MAIKQTFHLDPIPSHLVKPIIGNLDDNQMLVEKIFNISGMISQKFG
jgi:hypothetical protein